MSRLRKRSQRHQPLYYFSSSESDSTSDVTKPSRRPARSSQRLRNQRDNLEDSQDDLSGSLEGDAGPPAHTVTHTSAPPKRKASRTETVRRRSKRRKVITRATIVKPLASQPIEVLPVRVKSDRPPPPWQTLDYQILLRIMQYAAYPLYVGASRDTGSIQWLLDASCLCFSFRDACIGALMASPPLYPANRAHGTLKLLKLSAAEFEGISTGERERRNCKVSLNYRTKVRSLNIEVRHILLKKQGIILKDLLSCTPLLKDLRLYHSHDALIRDFLWAQPQYAKGRRWSYGDLFDTLDQLQIELSSFEWNGRFLRQEPTLDIIPRAHGQKCLQRLKSLSLLHLGIHSDGADQYLAECRANLLIALEHLTDLQHLSIHNSDVLDGPTMALIPSTLQSLVVENCLYVTSEAMQDYLSSKGFSLLILRLLHNQSMSLQFMTSLQTMTPKLQHLEIDLTYHDTTSFRDTEPLFDSLLPSGPPSWPLGLTYISIEPLRLLTTNDAEEFFESLVSAAPWLTHLRELRLKTILNDTGWRDRARMRSKWTAKMTEVFLSDADYGQAQQDKQKRTSNRAQSAAALGTCHTVEFELSDQRPAQEQYKEADFLDAEPSDDAEWNGRDRITPPKYSAKRYAW